MKTRTFFIVLILNFVFLKINAQNIRISKEQNSGILKEFILNEIKPEIFTLKTNVFGKIISIDSKQESLKKMFINKITIPIINFNKELIEGKSEINFDNSKLNGFEIVNIERDSTSGKLFTAVKLADYISQQKYNEAFQLFSNRQCENIYDYIKEKENLEIWITAWTLDDNKLKRYTSQIIRGGGTFTYEDEQWKIDEN